MRILDLAQPGIRQQIGETKEEIARGIRDIIGFAKKTLKETRDTITSTPVRVPSLGVDTTVGKLRDTVFPAPKSKEEAIKSGLVPIGNGGYFDITGATGAGAVREGGEAIVKGIASKVKPVVPKTASEILERAKGIVSKTAQSSESGLSATALQPLQSAVASSIERSRGQALLISQRINPPASSTGGSLPPNVPESGDAVKRFMTALKEAPSVREEQETLYSAERSRRLASALSVGEKVPGEKGFYQQLGTLKGELPKAEFESLRSKIAQSDIDELFNMVERSPRIAGFEKISTKAALVKMFGDAGGQVPTTSEIALLRRVFPDELVDTILSKRTLFEKSKDLGYQLVNVPRSLMSSFLDLSFGFRQGIFAAPKFHNEFADSFIKQFKWFSSEDAFKAANELIEQNPLYELAREAKVAFAEIGEEIAEREERYASPIAEKIPVLGRVVRATGRAYTAFANKFRMDIFASMVRDAERAGLNPTENKDLTKAIATFVNDATGRGKLPDSIANSAKLLNSIFFSPRLMASRLRLLNPLVYVRQPPFVRRQAFKTLFSFTSSIVTVLGLAKMAGGDVGTDPRSADFGKIRVGNTRVDVMGGFQQYIRMAAQLISGQYVSTTTGKVATLGEGYKPLTRYDILLRQIESKEAPIASFITTLLRQQDYAGKPVDVKKEIAERLVPMLISDVYDLWKDDPSLLPLGILAVFGMGVQTYESARKQNQFKSKAGGSGIKKSNVGKSKLLK